MKLPRWSWLPAPYRGARLGRALLRELRETRAEQHSIMLALNRIARALEQQQQHQPVRGAQVFRGFPLEGTVPAQTDAEIKAQTDVSYADPRMLERLMGIEMNLREVLGREPTEGEMERAIAERL